MAKTNIIYPLIIMMLKIKMKQQKNIELNTKKKRNKVERNHWFPAIKRSI